MIGGVSKTFSLCFVYPIFLGFFFFWSLLVTKLQKYYVIFVYILLGKMGKTGKNRKENHATKVAKVPKAKRRIYGMNETLLNQLNILKQQIQYLLNYRQFVKHIFFFRQIYILKNSTLCALSCIK